MDRLGEQPVDRTALDRTTRIHDLHTVDHTSDDTEVVRDQDDRRAQLVLDALHHLENLSLHGDVERRGRLVGDQHRRLVGDRHRNHHALAHATRELVRILHRTLIGLGNADDVEQLDRTLVGIGLVDVLVGLQHLDDLATDLVDRVERRQRILEDHRNPLATNATHLLGRATHQLVAVDRGRALDDRGLGQQTHQAQEGHRLARAGLADDAHHLALADVEIDATHGLDRAVHGWKRDAEVA